MELSDELLVKIAPRANTGWAAALNPAMAKFDINTINRVAAFLAQVLEESGQFSRLSENLNYSAQRLVQVFPHEFPTLAIANDYAGSPWKIADRVYANRLGNGDEKSGDGWKFHGRGLIQLTGRGNYADCAKGIEDTLLLACPDRLLTKTGAALSAAWFFASRGCNTLADTQQFEEITKKVNGAAELGEGTRLAYYTTALEVLSG